jgi:N,N'-diacetyllegionaminate synthase
MKIEHHNLNEKVFLIAEIGNNHEGSYSLAEEMVGLAAQAGADAVKFQTIDPEKLIAKTERQRLQTLKRFVLSYAQYEKLASVAKREGVLFLSTPFDREGARFLEPLVPAFKIASGDNNYFALIEEVARFSKPLLLSTGMATLSEIIQTVSFIRKVREEGKVPNDLALLHCVSSYPTQESAANLLAIKYLREKFQLPIGYSDHTKGTQAAILAVAVGARIIEKHFTISHNYSDFRDHSLSADPKEFHEMVQRIREAEVLLGTGEREVASEIPSEMVKSRRSIVAARTLEKGAILRKEDLNWLRPGTGLPPGAENLIIGRRALRHIEQGERILSQDVNPCAG